MILIRGIQIFCLRIQILFLRLWFISILHLETRIFDLGDSDPNPRFVILSVLSEDLTLGFKYIFETLN